jgi:hypothetical protein
MQTRRREARSLPLIFAKGGSKQFQKEVKVKKNFIRLILIVCLSIGLASMVFAQRQVGSITGVITDSERNALPGVNVTVSSPALMGTQSYVATEGGNFRFPSLPPGTYTIKTELSGFKTVTRENIIVSVGIVITVNFTLEIAALKEEVTVVASAPVVDISQSKTSFSIERSVIENLPASRNVKNLVLSAPGFGGSRHHLGPGYMGAEGYTMHGSPTESNTFASDGLIANDPQAPVGSLATPNLDSIDEIELVTGSHPAETPFTSGLYLNIVTKSGGNKFSGGANFYYSGKQLTETLWSKEEMQALGVQLPVQNTYYYDASLNLGGPIFRDKLWFYALLRYEDGTKRGNLIEWTDPLGIFHSNYNSVSTAESFFIKLTSQITPKLKLFGLFDYRKSLDTTGEYAPTPYQLKISTNYYDQWRWNAKINATYVFSQNLFADISAGHVYRYFPSMSQQENAGRPWIQDFATPYPSFTGRSRDSINYRRVTTLQADLTYFKDDFLFSGNHQIKIGVRYENDPCAYDNYYPNNLDWYWSNGPYYFGRTTWKGVPNVGWGRIQYKNMGAYKGSVNTPQIATRYGAYIQDSITFKNRLTLNLGLRFDYQTTSLLECFKDVGGDPMSVWLGENYVKPYTKKMFPEYFPDGINPYDYLEMPDWKNIYTWNDLSPRIGITYDLFGNQKTALKASYSRYTDSLTDFGPHPLARVAYRFDWYDTNPNPGIDPSTPWLMIDVNDDFVVYPADYRSLSLEYNKKFIDADFSSPKTDEFTLGIQHELFRDFLFGFTFILKNNYNIDASVLYSFDLNDYWYHIDQDITKKNWIPFAAIVPGFDGYPDSTVTFYARKNDAPPIITRRTNVPELERKYRGLEFIFNKRMSNGWQFSGSVTFSEAYGNIGGYYREGEPSGRGPNSFVNNYGRLKLDIPLFIKLSGTANLGYGFLLSGYFRHFDGEPWGRTANIRPPANWCTANNVSREYYTVSIEPPDTRRYKSYDFLDARIEKEFKIGGFGKVGLFVDFYNLLGSRGIALGQQDVYRYDPSAENVLEPKNATLTADYKKISGVEGLRTVYLSIRFSF